MGSLRNPIGPLPSSIYWRRRAVALVVLAILALLAVWVFALSGSGGTDDQGKNGGGGGPVSTITPGPTESGPAISERPGGREDVGGGSDAGSSSAGSSSGGSSGGAAGGGSGGGGTGEGGGSGGEGGTDDGASGGGDGSGWKPAVPAEAGSDAGSGGAKLPACAEPDVAVTLRSVEKTYEPGEKPEFELKAENDGGKPCSFDLGGKSTVVTVTDAADEDFWTSDDCRRAAKPATVQVPAKGEATRTFTWLRKPSAPDCGTPPAGSAAPGMYSAEVEIDGLKKAYAPFELEKA